MVDFDVHYGKHVRTFVELKSGLNSFRIGGPRPIDEKKLDFQAAFLELGTTAGKNSANLLVGRQELEYGSGRLIDVREGPNVRLSFDGFRLKAKLHFWQIDGLAVRPTLTILVSSTMCQIMQLVSGVYTQRAPRRVELLLICITWVLTALRLLSSAALLEKFGTRWVDDFRDPLQPNIQDGISITRAFGSSEPSAQRAFELGRLPQRLATALRPHR